MPKRSEEIREEAKAKHTLIGDILRLAGDTRDFSKKDILEKLHAADSEDAVKKWRALGDESHVLFKKAADAEFDEEAKAWEERDEELKRPKPSSAARPLPDHPNTQTIGQMFVESKAYRDWRSKDGGMRGPFGVELAEASAKTLLTTTAGFAPDSPRTSDVVSMAMRPIQTLEFIPVDDVTVSVVKWMEKTTWTVGAVEIAEAAAYPEPTYVWTERTMPIQKIAVAIPVTDEQLDDVPQMAALLDADLRFEVRQRLDGQVIVGNGTPPNIRGILNTAGIQTQAKGADPVFDAIFKGFTKIRAVGRAEPDLLLIHSTDFSTVRLARTADGIYLMGNPADPGSNRLFGVAVAINEVLTVGTALAGDFSRYARLKQRKGLEVEVGYSGANFTEGKKTFRAQMRVALVIRRAAAFCTVTGL